MSEETKKNAKMLVGLVIACFIVLGAEYFMFMRPIPAQNVAIAQANEVKVPTNDEILIGTYYDDFAPLAIHTSILKKVNGSYQITQIFNDGSNGTETLTVEIINGEERLVEFPNNPYGDYMVVESDNSIAFYDNRGFIYRLHPK